MRIRARKTLLMKSEVDNPKTGSPVNLLKVVDPAAAQAGPPAEFASTLTPARTALLLLATIAMAAALRIHSLAANSLWIDEAASVHFALLPWWAFLKVLWSYQGNMTLYYFLLRGWIHLGESEAAVRGLSVLFGVLTVPAVYALGTRLFNRATGLTGAALLAVHSFHIQWSQEARAYSLLCFLLVLTACFFVRAMESPRQTRYWAAFAVSAALSVYAHIFAVLLLPAYALAVIFPRPFVVKLRTIAVIAAVFALMIFPMAAFVLVQHSNQIDWMSRPTLADISQFLQLVTGEGGWWLAAIYFLLCGVAVVHALQHGRSGKEAWAVRLLGLWLVLPPLLTLAASPIKPLFFSRYMVMCVPALALLAGHGITSMVASPGLKRPAGVVALVLAFSLSGWGADRYFSGLSRQTEDWRSAVTYILDHQQVGDGAIFYIPNVYSYVYYVDRAEHDHRAASAPAVLFPSVPPHNLSRDELLRLTSGRSRVWLILCNGSVNPKAAHTIQSALAERLQPADSRVFPGEDPITVTLYRQPVNGR